jgi:transposase
MLRELNVVEQRYQAVLEVLDGIPVTEVAERFGVTRQTVHRSTGPLPRERAGRADRPLPRAEGSSLAGQR